MLLKPLQETLVPSRIISWPPLSVQIVWWSGHSDVAAVAQVRILVWRDNFLLIRFLEEEEHIQTKTKPPDASRIHEKKFNKKQYKLRLQQNVDCCREKHMITSSGNISPKPNQFMSFYSGPASRVVKALRCGRSNPSSNPALGRQLFDN